MYKKSDKFSEDSSKFAFIQKVDCAFKELKVILVKGIPLWFDDIIKI